MTSVGVIAFSAGSATHFRGLNLGWLVLAVAALELALVLTLRRILWRVVVEPIREIEAYADAIATGEEVEIRLVRKQLYWGELERLHSAVERMICLLDHRYERLQVELRERKRAQEALLLSQQQLHQTQKLEALGRVAGGIAHDFNNILCAMLMHLHQLQCETQSEDQIKGGLKELENEAQRAAELTRQLLLFSRRQRANARPLELNEVVRNMLSMLRRLVREDVEIVFEEEDRGFRVNGDPSMIEQVLMNLCVNARDAMEAGGRLTISTRCVRVESCKDRHVNGRIGDFVRLSVADQGCGIDSATMKVIFEPFFTTKEAGKGTGLGLATVFGVVKQHQGWIEVESVVGEGSVFHVFLPLLPEETKPETKLTEQQIPGGSETILLVEDDPSVRRCVALSFRRLGYAILEACNANEALKTWADHRDEISVLVTDMIMPGGMTGLQLARQLRLQDKDLGVIVSSGHIMELSATDRQFMQQVMLLPKPYDIATLARTVRACLDPG